jgi:Peptidase family M48
MFIFMMILNLAIGTQFPDLYASVDDFAATLHVVPTPTVYLSNGSGALNAFAAQSGWTSNYVVPSNELFANLRHDNREGTRFILGHEIAKRTPLRKSCNASSGQRTLALASARSMPCRRSRFSPRILRLACSVSCG